MVSPWALFWALCSPPVSACPLILPKVLMMLSVPMSVLRSPQTSGPCVQWSRISPLAAPSSKLNSIPQFDFFVCLVCPVKTAFLSRLVQGRSRTAITDTRWLSHPPPRHPWRTFTVTVYFSDTTSPSPPHCQQPRTRYKFPQAALDGHMRLLFRAPLWPEPGFLPFRLCLSSFFLGRQHIKFPLVP